MLGAVGWERNRRREPGTAAGPRDRHSEGDAQRRCAEFVRRQVACLVGNGRPILFLAGLCGLAGILLAPVGFSLLLPFFAAGLGALVLFCWMSECPAVDAAPDSAGEFGAEPGPRGAPFSPLPGATERPGGLVPAIAFAGRLVDRGNLAVFRLWRRQERAPEQRLLAGLFQETAALVGEEFVRTALGSLARSLQVSHVLLGETLGHTRIRVRQRAGGDRELSGFEYDVAGCACERVIGRQPRCYPAGVQGLFPRHPLARKLGAAWYLGVPLFGTDGRPMGLLAVLHDAPLKQPDLAESVCAVLAWRLSTELERIHAEQDLRRSERYFREVAFSDHLTGLSSRLLLMNRLEHAVEGARRSGHRLAVLFLDIDGFKRVNDTAGHDGGDQVLVDAARRISDCVRSSDTVARLGGDEFVVLLEECRGESEARTVAEHILSAFSLPLSASGYCGCLSASIGISTYDGSSLDIQARDLLTQADRAMYAAKRGGPGSFRFASSEPSGEGPARMPPTLCIVTP